ncbi:MAG: AbrB/MazE/SpoVT family DNA-binding domain-containing protein [Polaromonas sp.]|nr:AbrB/MazE/SpoVT family DNA-binding domain-containing protein [Polaromonas sp.]
MNGRSQAVRLPKSYRFEGTEVRIEKVGNSVVLTPVAQDRWRALEDALMAFEFEPGFQLERPAPMPASPREELFP